MKKFPTITTSFAVILSMIMAALPLSVKAADDYSLNNTAVQVQVSEKNGGFSIRTAEGDKINKDDNNKNLLFPLDDDNTSFASVRITRGGESKDYVFGGRYKDSSPVAVSNTGSQIDAVWSVDGVTVTQTIQLANSGDNQHGMAHISYTVRNSGAPAEIQLRLLMDTALGFQDYAYYRVPGENGAYNEIEFETEVTDYNKSFFAYDNPQNPTITAYTVNAPVNNVECIPAKVIFGHWNNLAATVFDYTPDPQLNFTNPHNKSYLTADSAYALYYDLAMVETEQAATVATYYGVYSNETVEAGDGAAINIAAPSGLKFTEGTTDYENNGDFSVTTQVENISGQNIDRMRIVVYPSSKITPYDQSGNLKTDATYLQPYYVDVLDFGAGDVQTVEWKFKAEPGEDAEYRKLTFEAYKMDAAAGDVLVAGNLLGAGGTYLVCPGEHSSLPEVTFTGSSPNILYTEGKRSLYLTGQNFSILESQHEGGAFSLKLSRTDGGKINGENAITIDKERFVIDEQTNTASISLTETLAEGAYEFIIDYLSTETQDITAPALRFSVVDDPSFRTDVYGIITVENDGDENYSIHTYATETEYAKSGKSLGGAVLLEFRGIFQRENDDPNGAVIGVSSGKSDNVMTLNQCLDIRSGRVTLSDNGGKIDVDFDAQLLLTGVGTSVWSGVSCLTSIEDGKEYSLSQYDAAGNRTDDGNITLLWPSVGQAAQRLLGLLFEFKYGELGYMEERGAVIGFGAAMDISFLVPKAKRSQPQTDALDEAREAMIKNGSASPKGLRELERQIPHDANTQSVSFETSTETGGAGDGGGAEVGDGDTRSATVQVEDILFGNGYVGCNFSLALGLPSYIDGMPSIEGVLSVKTIGDWALGMSGAASFANFAMDAEIQIMSKDNIPVPNTLRFFVGGFVPGINLDGVGVLWLQGAGGGIDNLYDTIFLTEKIPPLQLILQAQFSILNVISAQSEFRISLRGISAELSNGTVANSIVVMPSAKAELNWYPDLNFLASVNMSIADIITGGGYIVIDSNELFEFFLRAAIQIPGDIPIIGGITIASASLGANGEKIWGAAEIIGLKIGVTYYWGGEFSFNGDDVSPTYPELLGRSIVPVYTDPETQRTLYLSVGANVMKVAAPSKDKVSMDAQGQTHTVALMQSDSAAAVTLEWEADNETQAREAAKKITAQNYPIIMLDNTKAADDAANANANASLHYDNGKATLTISFTGEAASGQTYTIHTPFTAVSSLYRIAPLPKLSEITIEGNTAKISGEQLSRFDTITLFAVNQHDETDVRRIGVEKKDDAGWNGGTVEAAIDLPADLPSGDYFIKAAASDLKATLYSDVQTPYTHTNDKQPLAPDVSAISAAGDYKVSFAVTPAGAINGYRVNIYDKDGNTVEGVSSKLYDSSGNTVSYDSGGLKAEIGSAPASLTAGGRFTGTERLEKIVDGVPVYDENGIAVYEDVPKTYGLTAGESYTIGVSSWRLTDDGIIVYSEEKKSEPFTVSESVKTTFVWTGNNARLITETRTHDTKVVAFETEAYNTNDVTARLTASAPVSGSWTLDGGAETAVSATDTIDLHFLNLSEGTHTFSFTGKNAANDSAVYEKTFSVDTQPPVLQLETPESGSFYGGEKVVVNGWSDAEKIVLKNLTANTETTPMAGGNFSGEIKIDVEQSANDIELTAYDAVGNATTRYIRLLNPKLGDIKSLSLYWENEDKTNEVIKPTAAEAQLKLIANLSDGETMELQDATLVDWHIKNVSGDADLSGGKITGLTKSSKGMITASFLVADSGSLSASAAYSGEEMDYAAEKYTITCAAPANGRVRITADGENVMPNNGKYTVSAGQSVTVTASANNGYVLDSLMANGVSVDSPYTFSASENVAVSAMFKEADTPKPNGGSSSVRYYTAVFETNGGSKIDSIMVKSNTTLKKPDGPTKEGFQFDGWYTDPACTREYDFDTKVTSPITLYAKWVERKDDPTNSTEPEKRKNPFGDVRERDWFYENVQYVYENNLFAGVSDTEYAPNSPMTRAMLVTVLYRAAGQPDMENEIWGYPFADVDAQSWYGKPVYWARMNGIVKGYSDEEFAPDQEISREQIAAILERYADFKGMNTEEKGDLSQFADTSQISDWAKGNVEWAVGAGLMSGKGDDVLDPLGSATRAEVAAMLQRFLEK